MDISMDIHIHGKPDYWPTRSARIYTVRWRKSIRHVVLGQFSESFASCHCCERNFDYINCLSSRTCGAGRPHVWLCHALLVFFFFSILCLCCRLAKQRCILNPPLAIRLWLLIRLPVVTRSAWTLEWFKSSLHDMRRLCTCSSHSPSARRIWRCADILAQTQLKTHEDVCYLLLQHWLNGRWRPSNTAVLTALCTDSVIRTPKRAGNRLLWKCQKAFQSKFEHTYHTYYILGIMRTYFNVWNLIIRESYCGLIFSARVGL